MKEQKVEKEDGTTKSYIWIMHFDSRVRLEFHGATITSDAGLLAARELDESLGLSHLGFLTCTSG
jgi:hypothetical protein